MTRVCVFILLVCSGFVAGSPLTASATIALVPHFEKPLGQHVLNWITPTLAEVFYPAGLSVEWYRSRDVAPVNAARTLDVKFHGDCWPMGAQGFWGRRADSDHIRLGWVHSQGGHIAEEIEIDCYQVAQLAVEVRDPTPNNPLTNIVFLRLLGRVLGHELLHVLLTSARHGSSDFTRARMQGSDWQRVGRLAESEVDALRRLYSSPEMQNHRAAQRSPAGLRTTFIHRVDYSSGLTVK